MTGLLSKIILLSLASLSAEGFASSLLSQCYDGKSAKACSELSLKLGSSSAPSDRERSKLARQRACALGDKASCNDPLSASPAPSTAGPSHTAKEMRDKMVLKRDEVEAELVNLPELLQAARLEARTQGFEFVQIEPKSAYEKLGFRLGDILLEINGHVLESSTQAMEMFVLMRSETSFKVKLKRAGQIILRLYEIAE